MEESPFSELETPPLEKKWLRIAEKAIGVILAVLGIFMIVGLISFDSSLFTDYYPGSVFSKIKNYLLRNVYLIFLIFSSLFSGLFILIEKKIGWVVGVGLVAHITVNMLYLIFTISAPNHVGELVGRIGVFSLFALLFYILFKKQLLIRFEIKQKDYYLVAFLFLFLTALRILRQL